MVDEKCTVIDPLETGPCCQHVFAAAILCTLIALGYAGGYLSIDPKKALRSSFEECIVPVHCTLASVRDPRIAGNASSASKPEQLMLLAGDARSYFKN